MRVLVTGATGFVGYVVAAALRDAGHDVVALCRSGADVPDGVARVPGDLLDAGSVGRALAAARVDGVCHLAALGRVRDSRADPLAYWRTNVGGTLALLDAAASTGVTRVVAASTCAVYGEGAAPPISEAAVPEPANPYGAGKLAADRALADLAATGAVGAVSLRAFNVAGAVPGRPDHDETRLVPKAVAVALGRAPELVVNGDGSVVRDYVHVADMADAFVRALDACEPGRWRAYNVGGGRGSTIAEVIAATEAAAGRPLPVRHDPPAAEPRALLADASRIRAELGWRPRRSGLQQIVDDAVGAARGAWPSGCRTGR